MATQPDDYSARSIEPRAEIRAVPDERSFPIAAAQYLRQDQVRWGPIVAGLVTALTTLVLLGLLGVAIGLTAVNAGATGAQGTILPDVGRNSGIWAAVSGLIAFFLGGFVTGRTSAIFDRNWGALNGALVFLLAVPLALWLAGQGFGAMMGFVGSVAQGMNINPNAVSTIQGNVPVTPSTVQAAAEASRNAAWVALVGALVGLVASILGGMLGTRTEMVMERSTTTATVPQ